MDKQILIVLFGLVFLMGCAGMTPKLISGAKEIKANMSALFLFEKKIYNSLVYEDSHSM